MPIKPENLSRYPADWKQISLDAKERAGLVELHFHDSRHTAATWIGRSGRITVLEMCAMFGWRDPRHAMVYFNPSPGDIAGRL